MNVVFFFLLFTCRYAFGQNGSNVVILQQCSPIVLAALDWSSFKASLNETKIDIINYSLPADLSTYRFIIVPFPDLGLNNSTLDILANFTKDGGLVFGLGDRTSWPTNSNSYDKALASLNAISERIGSTMRLNSYANYYPTLSCTKGRTNPNSFLANLTIYHGGFANVIDGWPLAWSSTQYSNKPFFSFDRNYFLGGDTKLLSEQDNCSQQNEFVRRIYNFNSILQSTQSPPIDSRIPTNSLYPNSILPIGPVNITFRQDITVSFLQLRNDSFLRIEGSNVTVTVNGCVEFGGTFILLLDREPQDGEVINSIVTLNRSCQRGSFDKVKIESPFYKCYLNPTPDYNEGFSVLLSVKKCSSLPWWPFVVSFGIFAVLVLLFILVVSLNPKIREKIFPFEADKEFE